MCESSNRQGLRDYKRWSASSPFSCRPLLACFCVLAFGLITTGAAQNAPTVSKVEPPSWWSDHSINPVRLLLRGMNLSGARVRATRPQTVVSDVRINRNGTYLFVNVRISTAAQPGEYPLLVETAQGKVTAPFRLNAPLDVRQNFQGINNDDV